jgi:hypothetical protein
MENLSAASFRLPQTQKSVAEFPATLFCETG